MKRPGLMSRVRSRLARAIAPPGTARDRTAFAAAQFGRNVADWVFSGWRSASDETKYELRIMRDRARELDRNSPFGQRYSQVLAENVIGPSGIRLKAKNLGDDGEPAKLENKAIQDAWVRWCKVGVCDVTKRFSFVEALSLAVSEWGTDGEILIRLYRGPRFGPFGFAMQVLDPDLLDEKLNQERTKDTPMIRQGVEMDEFGAPAAYHLWTAHPMEPTLYKERVRVPASDVIHAFIAKRAGQVRGIPHGAAIMTTIKMLDGYVEAELVAARTASATMASIEDLPGEDGWTPAPNPNAGGSGDPSTGDMAPAMSMEVEPGSMLDLRGKRARLALWDPQHPTSAFPDFTRMMAHYTAMGYGMSYGTLTGDLSQANYGSLRVGMLDERDHWRRLQQFIIDHVVDVIYDEWLKMALLNKQIVGLRDYSWARWIRRKWMPRGFDWIDPLKDVQGELIEVAAGANSLTRMCAERGYDLEEILEERAEEIELFEEYGVPCVLGTTILNATSDAQDTNPDDAANSESAAEKSWPRALPVASLITHAPLSSGSRAARRRRISA